VGPAGAWGGWSPVAGTRASSKTWAPPLTGRRQAPQRCLEAVIGELAGQRPVFQVHFSSPLGTATTASPCSRSAARQGRPAPRARAEWRIAGLTGPPWPPRPPAEGAPHERPVSRPEKPLFEFRRSLTAPFLFVASVPCPFPNQRGSSCRTGHHGSTAVAPTEARAGNNPPSRTTGADPSRERDEAKPRLCGSALSAMKPTPSFFRRLRGTSGSEVVAAAPFGPTKLKGFPLPIAEIAQVRGKIPRTLRPLEADEKPGPTWAELQLTLVRPNREALRLLCLAPRPGAGKPWGTAAARETHDEWSEPPAPRDSTRIRPVFEVSSWSWTSQIISVRVEAIRNSPVHRLVGSVISARASRPR